VRDVKAQREAGEGDTCWPLALRVVDWGKVVKPPVTKPTARIQAVPKQMSQTATPEQVPIADTTQVDSGCPKLEATALPYRQI